MVSPLVIHSDEWNQLQQSCEKLKRVDPKDSSKIGEIRYKLPDIFQKDSFSLEKACSQIPVKKESIPPYETLLWSSKKGFEPAKNIKKYPDDPNNTRFHYLRAYEKGEILKEALKLEKMLLPTSNPLFRSELQFSASIDWKKLRLSLPETLKVSREEKIEKLIEMSPVENWLAFGIDRRSFFEKLDEEDVGRLYECWKISEAFRKLGADGVNKDVLLSNFSSQQNTNCMTSLLLTVDAQKRRGENKVGIFAILGHTAETIFLKNGLKIHFENGKVLTPDGTFDSFGKEEFVLMRSEVGSVPAYAVIAGMLHNLTNKTPKISDSFLWVHQAQELMGDNASLDQKLYQLYNPLRMDYWFNHLQSFYSHDPLFLGQLAEAYLDQHNLVLGIHFLMEAEKTTPKNPSLNHAWGIAFALLGKIPEAIRSFEDNITVNKFSVFDSHEFLSRVYQKSPGLYPFSEYEKALSILLKPSSKEKEVNDGINLLKKFIEQHPQNRFATIVYHWALLGLRKEEKETEKIFLEIDRVLSSSPGNDSDDIISFAHNALILFFIRKEDPEKALRYYASFSKVLNFDFKKWIQSLPIAESKKKDLLYMLGIIEISKGRGAHGRKILFESRGKSEKELLEKYKSSHEYSLLELLEKAFLSERNFDKALQINFNNPAILRSYVEKGKYNKAISFYEDSWLVSSNGENRYWVGIAYLLSGDKKEAKKHLEAAAKLEESLCVLKSKSLLKQMDNPDFLNQK